jgi:hypothetical protein
MSLGFIAPLWGVALLTDDETSESASTKDANLRAILSYINDFLTPGTPVFTGSFSHRDRRLIPQSLIKFLPYSQRGQQPPHGLSNQLVDRAVRSGQP